MDLSTLIQTLANATVTSAVYMLVAVGLALAFGTLRMANFAHGEFFMVGAYVVYVFYGIAGWPFFLAVFMAMPIVALLGLATERFVFRPTRRNILAGFMATAGLSLVLQVVVGQIWGVGLPKSVPTPFMGAANIFGAFVGWQRLIVIPCTLAMLVALHLFLKKTKFGKALRASIEDPETAACQGIKTSTTTAIAMAIAGASAGLAGSLMAPEYSVTPYMGHNIVIIAFIVVVVGGLSSVPGAMIAAGILGFIHTFVTTLWDSTIANMVGVAFMALTLVFRPAGLMGEALPEAAMSTEGSHGENVEWPKLSNAWVPVLGIGAVVALALFLPHVLGRYQVELLIILVINLVLVSSFRLITICGDWSLSHVVMMGVGSYAAALLAKLAGLPFWATVPLAGVAAAMIGLLLALPLVRTRAFGFFIASLALGELIRLVWIRVEDPFGGTRGMINVPMASFGSINLNGYITYFYVVSTVALVCLYIMHRVETSKMGTAWKCIEADTGLARSLGINISRYRMAAFTIGSFFAGVAGALLVHRLGAVDPKSFGLTTMIYLIIWVVVGGTATFWGPILGLALVTIAFEWTRPLAEWRPLIFGSLLILFLIYLPKGMESLWPQLFAMFRKAPSVDAGQSEGENRPGKPEKAHKAWKFYDSHSSTRRSAV